MVVDSIMARMGSTSRGTATSILVILGRSGALSPKKDSSFGLSGESPCIPIHNKAVALRP